MRSIFKNTLRLIPKWQILKCRNLLIFSTLTIQTYSFTKSLAQEKFNVEKHSQQEINEFLDEMTELFANQFIDAEMQLQKLITQSNQQDGELLVFSKDSHSYHQAHAPICILYASTTEDVQKFLSICNKHSINVVPYCQGTSLEGGVLPMNSQTALINFTYMSQILNLYEKDLCVQVEPGVTWMDLNKFLAKQGLFFPIDPGPGAGIGGMVGTNCSGTNAVRYGSMRDWVMNVEVVLADGTLIKTAQRAKKSSAGYNLTCKYLFHELELIVGSEGTLGLVTSITLRVTHLPKINSVVTACFSNLDQLGDSVHQLIKNEIPLACVELMDKSMVNLILQNQHNETNAKVLLSDQNLLMLKISGDSEVAQRQLKLVSQIISDNDGQNLQSSFDLKEIDRLWNIRKIALYIVQQYAQKVKGQNGQVWTTDVCVPISQLSKHIQQTQQEIDQNKIIGPIIGHVGDGNYHVIFVVDYSNPEEFKIIQSINQNMVERSIEAEGTCTGEHGIGIGKQEFLIKEKGIQGVNLMRNIKKVFDPKGILNPGKIFSQV